MPEAAERLGEFGRIARFFVPLAAPGGLGLTDDAALIEGPSNQHYVLTTDAIVEGVHFLRDDPPGGVAQKLLRVNLSDLAAKGAAPVGYLLTTVLPRDRDDAWLAAFAAGLAVDQARFGFGLLGGDSVATPGPATLSVAMIGCLPAGTAVLRRGALAGDRIFVSGTLGDAALGLALLTGRLACVDTAAAGFLAGRYRLPLPRLDLGQRLRGIAHAMADVSDGLVADLGHIAEASQLAAVIDTAALPLSPAAQASGADDATLLAAVLGGGDDYELVFTAPAGAAEVLERLAGELGVAITPIGRCEAGQGVRVIDRTGATLTPAREGYQHF